MIMLLARRAWLAATVVLSVTVLLAVGSLSASAHADASTVSVDIDSPGDGTVVSKSIVFSVIVDQSNASDPVTSVQFQIFGQTEGWQQQIVPVPSDGCVPSCSVSATFDTSSLVKQNSVLAADTNLSDGIAEFAATAWTSRGVNVTARTYQTIDNQRPSISLPDISYDSSGGQSSVVGGDTDIPLTVAVTPNSESSSPVTQIELFVPGSTGPWADQIWTAPVGGRGEIDLSLAGAPVGAHRGYLVATDAAGEVSSLRQFDFHVGRYTLALSSAAAYPDDINIIINPDWTDGTTAAKTWIQMLRAYVGGQLVGTSGSLGHPHDMDEVDLTPPDNGSFPLGRLTVLLKAVDNRGIAQQLTVPVTVRVPVTAHWSTTAAVVGHRVHASATLFSATHDFPISAKVSLDGKHFAAATPAAPTENLVISGTTAPISATGEHTLSAEVTLRGGYTYTLTRDVTATEPVLLTLHAPASTAWNRKLRLTTTAQSNGRSLSSTQLALWQRSGPSAHWSYLTKATTNADGHANFKVNAATIGTSEFEVRSAATQTLAAARSHTATIVVIPQFIGVPYSRTVHPEKVLKFEATTIPLDTHQRVALQIRRPKSSSYRTAQKLTGEHTIFSHRFTTPGTYRLRFHRYADNHYGATNSTTWTITVR